MGIVVDLIIIAFIVLSTFFAYKKGLIAQAIKLCAVVIALVATLILYRPVAGFIINTTNIDESIENSIYEKTYQIMINKDNTTESEQGLIEQATSGTIRQTAKDMSTQIINLAVILILFFGIKIALKFVTIIADKVAKLPILNKFNKAGGLIYGLLRGFVIVYACFLLIGFVGKIDENNFLHKSVKESTIGKVMYENNVLNVLL